MNKLLQLATGALLTTGIGLVTPAVQADNFSIFYSTGHVGHSYPSFSYQYNHGFYPHARARHYKHYRRHDRRRDRNDYYDRPRSRGYYYDRRNYGHDESKHHNGHGSRIFRDHDKHERRRHHKSTSRSHRD